MILCFILLFTFSNVKGFNPQYSITNNYVYFTIPDTGEVRYEIKQLYDNSYNEVIYDINLPEYCIYLTPDDLSYVDKLMIQKIVYFGYGYNENGYIHNDVKWYIAAQMLIWDYLYSDYYVHYDIDPNMYQETMDALDFMRQKIYIYNKPSFSRVYVPLKELISISDDNHMIDNSFIIYSNIDSWVEGNTLSINSSEVGDYFIDFVANANQYDPPIIYSYANRLYVKRQDTYPDIYRVDVTVEPFILRIDSIINGHICLFDEYDNIIGELDIENGLFDYAVSVIPKYIKVMYNELFSDKEYEVVKDSTIYIGKEQVNNDKDEETIIVKNETNDIVPNEYHNGILSYNERVVNPDTNSGYFTYIIVTIFIIIITIICSLLLILFRINKKNHHF